MNHFLKKNRIDFSSILSASYILMVSILAIFAGYIIPDKTENANQMQLAINSQPPGFKTWILKKPVIQNSLSTDNELKEIGHELLPITDYYFQEETLFFHTFGSNSKKDSIPLQFFPTSDPNHVEEYFLVKKIYYLGTDLYGRDLLSRLILGSRISLGIGLIAVFISLLVGVLFGAIAGYFGGKIDRLIMALINVVWAIPTLLLVIAIVLALGRGFWQVFLAVGLSMWVEVARVVRGQVKATKEKLYIQAVKVLGFSDFRILGKHILPTVISSLIVISAANFASAILMESGLSFLGIGAQPPVPSWGGMVKDHFRYLLLGKAYLVLLPGAAIMLLVLSFMLLGNNLRDYLDVRN